MNAYGDFAFMIHGFQVLVIDIEISRTSIRGEKNKNKNKKKNKKKKKKKKPSTAMESGNQQHNSSISTIQWGQMGS